MNFPITDGLPTVLVQERLRDADERRLVLQARTILRRRARARRRARFQMLWVTVAARVPVRRTEPAAAPSCC